ncbi:SDR family NAD(P)-dependent oxidoreductase [Acinetobacter haemolyticus]|uniref:SDR family NAD(P)-dependent oxidoreductase n=1 Tax=Acinetobacter haemolyticus TaxID=29430 RepID=UPI00148BD0CC|nr:SDR family NAD(P)-dependent oxidoreductase [Acinetobacter haemolyticus]
MMNKLGRLLKSSKNAQSCMVVFGENIELLSQAFINLDSDHPLHIFQVTHDLSQQDLKVFSSDNQTTIIQLNLLSNTSLKSLVKYIQQQGYKIELSIIQPKFGCTDHINTVSAEMIEQYWQVTGLNTVSVSQAMIANMLKQKKGTVIFLGARSAGAGKKADLLMMSMFASIRALSQSLAREFHPKGIHVAYCTLEKWDDQNSKLMQSIAQVCWHLHQQPKSTWTQELSLTS